ncbi:MAG: hypothetical protein LBT60_04935 [Oscillospiraceae bacterium]|jgi:hypothetical protein|nr:hypothetical protein [Oscillospiraceae bacterium]
MLNWLEDLAQTLRDATDLTVCQAFPDAPLPEETPVVALGLDKLTLRPAGLGAETARLAEAEFSLAVYGQTAAQCAQAAAALPGTLSGLRLEGAGTVYDPVTRRFVLRFTLHRRAVWPTEPPADAPPVIFDWKGEVVHEFTQ